MGPDGVEPEPTKTDPFGHWFALVMAALAGGAFCNALHSLNDGDLLGLILSCIVTIVCAFVALVEVDL